MYIIFLRNTKIVKNYKLYKSRHIYLKKKLKYRKRVKNFYMTNYIFNLVYTSDRLLCQGKGITMQFILCRSKRSRLGCMQMYGYREWSVQRRREIGSTRIFVVSNGLVIVALIACQFQPECYHEWFPCFRPQKWQTA